MEALLALALPAVLVWGLVLLLRVSLPVACLLVIVTGTVFGHAFLQIDLGPLPLTTDRIALGLLMGVYVLRQRWGDAEPKPVTPVDWCFAAFLTVLVFSTFTHPLELGLPGMPPTYWKLANGYLMPAVVYWIARQSRWSAKQFGQVYAVFLALAVYLAITGLAEVNGQWWLVYPRYIADPAVGLHFGRARGPFVDSISMGLFLSIGFVFVLIAFWKAGALKRYLLALPGLLLLAAVYYTYTRCFWIGAAAAVALVLALVLPSSWRWPVLGCLLIGGLAVVAVKWNSIMEFKRDRDLTAEQTGESARLRPIMAYVSWKMFLDRPLLGCGFGQYVVEKNSYLSDRTTEMRLEIIRPYPPHNLFLSLLTETGLVGLGLFLCLAGAWTKNAWRLWANATIPDWARSQGLMFLAAVLVFVATVMFHDTSHTPMSHMLLFFLAGMVEGLRPLAQACGTAAYERAPLFSPRGAVPAPA